MHYNSGKNFVRIHALPQIDRQAGAELGQAQVRLDDIVEVVIEVVVKAGVKVKV